MQESAIRFYQTGTWTVGNRLLDPTDRTVQSSQERHNALNSGHRACQGCGEALGARYAVDAAFAATNGQIIATNATGCLEVFSTPYPESAWQLPWFHSLFGNTAAVATGLAAAARVKARKKGGGLQSFTRRKVCRGFCNAGECGERKIECLPGQRKARRRGVSVP